MSIQNKTMYFIIVIVLFVAIVASLYDIYAMSKGGTEATISFIVFSWSYKYPIFTFASGFIPGVLVGHLFWRIRDTEKTKEISDDSRK